MMCWNMCGVGCLGGKWGFGGGEEEGRMVLFNGGEKWREQIAIYFKQ